MKLLRIVLVLSVALVGCGSEDPDDNAELKSSQSKLYGKVHYEGTASGHLVVALYSAPKPAGPPDGGEKRFDNVVFDANGDYQYSLDLESAGTWTVYLLFDVGGNNPTFPGAEDYGIVHETRIVVEETAKDIELNFVLPATKP